LFTFSVAETFQFVGESRFLQTSEIPRRPAVTHTHKHTHTHTHTHTHLHTPTHTHQKVFTCFHFLCFGDEVLAMSCDLSSEFVEFLFDWYRKLYSSATCLLYRGASSCFIGDPMTAS